ncbi:MAG: acyl-CoA dehydrogenase, partial [Burkholderiales bacterium]|nr:acyl-CoA dehydrogenase [Burkholderiales bacterium]
MDFSWTDEQLMLKKAVIKFAQQELNEGLIERDRQSEFLMENWLKCANFGLLSLPIPEQYGGAEADILTAMLAMEGFGYGCRDNGLILALSAQMWSVQLPILTFGTEVQKQKLLPGMCKGEIIGAYAMTEPDVGSDASSIRTRADRRDGSYVLNGAKMFVTNASIADVFLVFATVDPTRGMGGITAFLVPANTPGLTVSRELEKMGLRTSPMAELTLEGCSVTEDSRLGPEGG